MKSIIATIFCFLALAIASCQQVGFEADDAVSIDICFEGDPSAFNLGRECAERLLKRCHSESEICDELLEIRAREYNIRCRVSNEAADSYISGFKTRLQESGDTLCVTLFK